MFPISRLNILTPYNILTGFTLDAERSGNVMSKFIYRTIIAIKDTTTKFKVRIIKTLPANLCLRYLFLRGCGVYLSSDTTCFS